MTNVTLVLNDAEQQALHQLLDAALRQSGLNAIDVVSHFMGRIIAAQGAATQAQGASQKPMQAQPAVPLQPAAAVSPVQSHASQSEAGPCSDGSVFISACEQYHCEPQPGWASGA